MGDVVGVHARHERAARLAEGGVQGRDESAPLGGEHAHSRIRTSGVFEDGAAAVRGAVVHGDHLVVRQGLDREGGEALAEEAGRVADREQDRDPGRGQTAS
jgi:hypothetical protein